MRAGADSSAKSAVRGTAWARRCGDAITQSIHRTPSPPLVHPRAAASLTTRSRPQDGWTPLQLAALRGHTDCLAALLETTCAEQKAATTEARAPYFPSLAPAPPRPAVPALNLILHL